MNEDVIEIVEYDSTWQQMAVDEISTLRKIFSGDINIRDIQHVGSTAIPGIAAKPIIDIYIGVDMIEKAQSMIKPLEDLSYIYWADNPNPKKMFFVKGMPPYGERRTHHLHAVEFDSDYWCARILFRDHLRQNPSLAAEYAKLKKELSEKYSQQRELYSNAKTQFIAHVLKSAGFMGVVSR
jgi:GrpB-like predicted nucleotidyltransferase (UPF0157 family)